MQRSYTLTDHPPMIPNAQILKLKTLSERYTDFNLTAASIVGHACKIIASTKQITRLSQDYLDASYMRGESRFTMQTSKKSIKCQKVTIAEAKLLPVPQAEDASKGR